MAGKRDMERLKLGRPKQALITREAAIKAALATIDGEGLENFSLNSVARLMGVKAPSLYYHFQDKAELLAGVARQVLVETDYREIGEGSWEDSTISLCVKTRRALLKHPNAAPLILQFFPRHLLLGAYEHAVAGYPQTRNLHMAILEGIEKLTFGSALFAAAAGTAGISPMPDIDAAHYPNLAQSVAASPFDDEDTFVEALRMLLAGVRLRTQVQAG
jgi:TetR/AcrR family transcriptional regulator, tetracycline repressor protein